MLTKTQILRAAAIYSDLVEIDRDIRMLGDAARVGVWAKDNRSNTIGGALDVQVAKAAIGVTIRNIMIGEKLKERAELERELCQISAPVPPRDIGEVAR